MRHVAAAELGYNVDRIARALASGRTGTVGLLFGSLEDLWQQLLGVGIGRALLARDHYALLVDAAGDPERQLLLATSSGTSGWTVSSCIPRPIR